jgi:hypothetical protein
VTAQSPPVTQLLKPEIDERARVGPAAVQVPRKDDDGVFERQIVQHPARVALRRNKIAVRGRKVRADNKAQAAFCTVKLWFALACECIYPEKKRK